MKRPNTKNTQQNLQAIDLWKSYGQKAVVRGVSLSVERASIVGLLGPNGAGKTTCFYLIAGVESADKGSLLLNTENISNWAIHHRVRYGLGYLPQEPSVFRHLSVHDNVLAVLESCDSASSPKQRLKKCRTLLKEFGLYDLSHQKAGVLSGGERRRLEIARVLAIDPLFLLLDEPFAGVDPIAVTEIKQLVIGLSKRGIGVLITDHNVREALDLCDKAYVLSDGVICASGTSTDIINNQKVRDIYLGKDF